MTNAPYREPPLSPLRRRLLTPQAAGFAAFLLVWAIAAKLPALRVQYTDTNELDSMSGGACAALGVFAAFWWCPAWFANLTALLSASLLWLRRYIAAGVLSAVSLALGATTFFLLHSTFPVDEAGARNMRVIGVGPACALWFVSLAIPGATALWIRARQVRSGPRPAS
jgi:hypothetical protein